MKHNYLYSDVHLVVGYNETATYLKTFIHYSCYVYC